MMTVTRRKCRGKNARSRAGFTLMEVMIASVIFLIASLGFSFGLIAALKTQYMASDHYSAMTISRNRIQRARSLDFSTLTLLNESMIRVDNLGNQSPTGFFFRSTSVTNVATNCVEISISVHFIEPSGRTSAVPVTIQTMIADGM